MGAGSEGDDAQPRVDATFPRSARVRKRFEHRAAQERGRRVQTPHFVLIVLARDGQGPSRLGITVTKKIGTAVARNRTKRVLREVFRQHRALFPAGADVVAIAKDGAPSLGFADVLAEVRAVAPALAEAARRGARPPRPAAPKRAS